ncbi:uncharacterized protein LOC130664680 [Microplitis mediator]|uniref:uncharacterized protein LOC130664680 n=1 Tax=Microplitis mediator TaxID=375433 RepID=UPI0025536182|nr:uncharacterized protein LOC130664680 [Microplitis mediator]
MKGLVLAVLAVVIYTVSGFPQKDGQAFSNEAISQARNTLLIPKDAQIQHVQEGIELVARESIPGDEKIDLFAILRDVVPREVVDNLQPQIDGIGQH